MEIMSDHAYINLSLNEAEFLFWHNVEPMHDMWFKIYIAENFTLHAQTKFPH